MKKYSWIVALLLALSFTAIFIGCGADALEAPPPELGDFTKIPLGDFNCWAGAEDKQQGWATDGFKFLGVGDKEEVAEAKGYQLDDFLNANYLVLELASGQPSDGLQLIWGGEGATDAETKALGGWNAAGSNIMSDGRVLQPCAGLVGTTLTINLATALKDYDKFSDGTATGVRILLQYWNQGIDALGIKEAYLLIANKFTPVTKLTIVTSEGIANKVIQLEATIEPFDASVTRVTWQIVQEGNTASAEFLPTFFIDDAYYPPVKTDVVLSRARDKIITFDADGGSVKIRATLKDGGENASGDKIDVFVEKVITIAENPFPELVNATAMEEDSTKEKQWPLKKYVDDGGTLKYFVVASVGGGENGGFNEDGFGGLQMVLQGDKTGWQQVNTPDFTDLAHAVKEVVYFVFDLTKWTDFDKLGTNTDYYQFLQNGGDSWGAGVFGVCQGYVVGNDVTLTKPVSAVNLVQKDTTTVIGWVATVAPAELLP